MTLNLNVFAQRSGYVMGIVKENGEPVEFANVYLTLQTDSAKIITATVSDEYGKFLLENVGPGNYFLNVRVMGARQKKIPVILNTSTPFVNLSDISMETDPRQLNAVEIRGMRNLIEKTEEGFVVNAADNITQIGGTAADLLKNMPGVLVNADGEITLRGRTPLTLINGRISGITGVDRSAQLERIPASSIDRIEIINNPSARYDADSEGGIINIILKKNEDRGTNGAFAIGAGLGERYRLNASGLLNHKTDKWNVGLEYDNWYTTRTRRLNGDRLNFDLPDQYYLIQRRSDERLVLFQNAKATIDYAPDKKNNLSLEALWAFPGENNSETLNSIFETSERNFASSNKRHSNEIRRSHAVEASLVYNRVYNNPDKLLSANISNTFGRDRENTDITTQPLSEQEQPLGNSSLERTHTYENSNLSNFSLDYANPVSARGMFDAGYKSIFRYLNSDFERANFVGSEFAIDPFHTDVFMFREQIHAAYSEYTGWTGEKETPEWKYNVGLRAELVKNNGKIQNESQDFTNAYFNLFPSGSLLYYTKNRDNFKLSYSRRITRPGLGELNPFIDITDSVNQHSGNPELKPELIHSMEFEYNHLLKKGSVSLTAFHRIRKNAIFSYTVLDSNGIALSRPANFGNASSSGIELIMTDNPFAFWSVNLSFSLFDLRIDSDGSQVSVSNNPINWYAKLSNTFELFRNTKLQVIGSYTSATAIPQGKSLAVYYVDAGVQHKIMREKGRLGLTITDIFNTQEYGYTTADHNFEFKRRSKLDTRAVMLTFGYTFGTAFKEKLMENKFKND